MRPARCTDEDYIQFLLSSPDVVSATEASRCHPLPFAPPSHDAYRRLIHDLEPQPEQLWLEVRPLVQLQSGALVIDDTVLDKPYAKYMSLVGYHWSGKHHRPVRGINLLSCVWTDGETVLPVDYSIKNPAEPTTKHDAFRQALRLASERGFKPECVAFDTWYASVENLKCIEKLEWTFLTRVKTNRLVSVQQGTYQAIETLAIAAEGMVVHLKEFGQVKVFRTVARDGGAEYWITNDLNMTPMERQRWEDAGWQVEVYHRGVKQHTGIEGCQMRSVVAQSNHIGCALRAFIRLEYQRYTTGTSWFELARRILRSAIKTYRQKPWYVLPKIANPPLVA